MPYSQQPSIVWSGHWRTLLQCIFSDPIIYPVPSHDLHFQHQMVLSNGQQFHHYQSPLTETQKRGTTPSDVGNAGHGLGQDK
jgi:hypothetical protein